MEAARFYDLTKSLMKTTGIEVPFGIDDFHGRQSAGTTFGKHLNGYIEHVRITFNRDIVSLWCKDQCRNLVLHELAHVVVAHDYEPRVTLNNPHGFQWVRECRKLGVPAHSHVKKWPILKSDVQVNNHWRRLEDSIQNPNRV